MNTIKFVYLFLLYTLSTLLLRSLIPLLELLLLPPLHFLLFLKHFIIPSLHFLFLVSLFVFHCLCWFIHFLHNLASPSPLSVLNLWTRSPLGSPPKYRYYYEYRYRYRFYPRDEEGLFDVSCSFPLITVSSLLLFWLFPLWFLCLSLVGTLVLVLRILSVSRPSRPSWFLEVLGWDVRRGDVDVDAEIR